MSTLKVNTVQHNTSGFNNVVQFTDGAGTQNGTLCRAWVNFNGQGTVAIRNDFNVNTVTDSGTGDYTMNFSNAMSDVNYAAVCGSGQEDDYSVTVDNYATGSLGVRGALMQSGDTVRDVQYCNVAIFH